jgi:hypothetical protein
LTKKKKKLHKSKLQEITCKVDHNAEWEKELGIPHHMSHNIVLPQNQPVQVPQHSHRKYRHMDLGQASGFLEATLQLNLEDQTWDSYILEAVDSGLFQHNEMETVLEINGKTANPSV